MKIERVFYDNYYNEKSRYLGNCYNITIDKKTYHYEFLIKNNTATIITDNFDYLRDAVREFRKDNKYINIFKTNDNSYYEEFDNLHTFKLPINILQVSKFFLNEERLNNLEKHLDLDEIYLPVKIINDEYVILDGHHRLYLAYREYLKMVNVYLDEALPYVEDFIYFAKEQNIKTIKDLKILPHEEYQEIWNEIINSLT